MIKRAKKVLRDKDRKNMKEENVYTQTNRQREGGVCIGDGGNRAQQSRAALRRLSRQCQGRCCWLMMHQNPSTPPCCKHTHIQTHTWTQRAPITASISHPLSEALSGLFLFPQVSEHCGFFTIINLPWSSCTFYSVTHFTCLLTLSSLSFDISCVSYFISFTLFELDCYCWQVVPNEKNKCLFWSNNDLRPTCDVTFRIGLPKCAHRMGGQTSHAALIYSTIVFYWSYRWTRFQVFFKHSVFPVFPVRCFLSRNLKAPPSGTSATKNKQIASHSERTGICLWLCIHESCQIMILFGGYCQLYPVLHTL